jgi:hypothetical protein
MALLGPIVLPIRVGDQPAQGQDLLGPHRIAQAGPVLGGQGVHDCGQGRQLVPSSCSNICSSSWRQPIKPPAEGKHLHKSVDTSRPTRRARFVNGPD